MQGKQGQVSNGEDSYNHTSNKTRIHANHIKGYFSSMDRHTVTFHHGYRGMDPYFRQAEERERGIYLHITSFNECALNFHRQKNPSYS